MKFKYLSYIVACSLAIGLFFLTGCEGDEGPAGTEGSVPVVIEAVASILDAEDSTANITATVANCLEVPSVLLNELNLVYEPGTWADFIYHDFPISPGEAAHLFVTFTQSSGENGVAVANIVMPGSFEVLSPDSSIDVSLTDSTEFSWTASSHADYYILSVNFNYVYNSGGYGDSNFEILTTETTVRVAPSMMFPNLEEINSFGVNLFLVSVHAVYGPMQGQPGNIEGDAIGVFHGKVREYIHID